MTRSGGTTSARTAHRSFWVLLIVAVLAAGSLTDALASTPAPATGLRLAVSGLLLVVSTALASRVLAALDRARTRSATASAPPVRTRQRQEGNT